MRSSITSRRKKPGKCSVASGTRNTRRIPFTTQMTTTENELMTAKTKTVPAVLQMFLLDKTKKRSDRFSLLHPLVVSSTGGLQDSLARATKDTLWVSYEKDLTEALLKTVLGPPRSLGRALLIHALNPLSVPVLTSCLARKPGTAHRPLFRIRTVRRQNRTRL